MSDGTLRESPLARFAAAARATSPVANAGIISAEKAFLGHINLRGRVDDPHFAHAVASVIGANVPEKPNTVRQGTDNTAYWLGPDEWLIITPGEQEAAVARDLRTALSGCIAAVTEVSGGQTVIALGGKSVRDLLAKGCPLDLHPRAFDVGRCAQSRLAKAPILIRQVDTIPSFEIIVRRSFASYLWCWLLDAAAEFGHHIETFGETSKARNTAAQQKK
ncbi:MAG: sarcosine oxidase subunit gamma family protein [Betaproteobacteria bacterium]